MSNMTSSGIGPGPRVPPGGEPPPPTGQGAVENPLIVGALPHELESFPLHDWQGPFGAPSENGRFGVAPPLSGAAFLSLLTNLITNPSFETGTTGWTSDNGGGVIARVRPNAVIGGYAGQCTTDASANSGIRSPGFTLQAGVLYQASIWVTAFNAPTFAMVVLVEDAAFTLKASTSITATVAPQLVQFSVIPTATGTHYLRVRRNAAIVAQFQVDGAMVVASPFNVAYFDGDSPDSSWSGSAHASAAQKRLDLYNNPPRFDWAILGPGDWSSIVL